MSSKVKQQDIKKNLQEERRSFLKKAVYATPKLIILGQLARPNTMKAGYGAPPSAPSTGNNW